MNVCINTTYCVAYTKQHNTPRKRLELYAFAGDREVGPGTL